MDFAVSKFSVVIHSPSRQIFYSLLAFAFERAVERPPHLPFAERNSIRREPRAKRVIRAKLDPEGAGAF